ncbi:MAG: hypothetical protein NC121_16510 [Blautia sp.]|nr:hypothetical protein [Blautia sp.]
MEENQKKGGQNIMAANFRLVPKFEGNCLVILYESNGDVQAIAQILLPADRQLADNVEVANDICMSAASGKTNRGRKWMNYSNEQ